MRLLGDIIGLLLGACGLVVGLGSLGMFPIDRQIAAGGIILGLILFGAGWIFLDAAAKKGCPECAERVKVAARRCKHCGHQFSFAA